MESLIISGFLFYDGDMHMGIFTSLVAGFLGGVIMGMFFIPIQLLEKSIPLFLGIIVLAIGIQKITRHTFIIPIVFSITFGAVVGFLRIDYFHQQYPFDQMLHFNDTTIQVVGEVHKSPEFFPTHQSVLITPLVINGEKIPEKTQRISVRAMTYQTFQAGDTVHVSGKFRVRLDFDSDTGRTVSYRMMSYSKKIAGDIYYPTLFEVVRSNPNGYTFLSRVKQKFLGSLNNLFTLPASGLLSGMMIGDTSSLNSDMLEVFRMVGLIHIVVLSGYNVTLVANAFISLFSFRGYYGRLVFAMVALVFFIGVVGVSQTALRAGIMALCVFSAQYFIRPYMISRALLIALAIMVWFSPYSLLFDLSLQLSFLATIGIVYLFPILQARFSKFSENILGEITLQTIAVNIIVLPMILYQMGAVSPVFLPLNILVLGFIPFLTIGGFLVTLLGFALPQVAIIGAYPIQYITDLIIRFAEWTAGHDPFYITLPPFSIWVVFGIYGILGLFIITRNTRQNLPKVIL